MIILSLFYRLKKGHYKYLVPTRYQVGIFTSFGAFNPGVLAAVIISLVHLITQAYCHTTLLLSRDKVFYKP